jgi:hypothetical protein
MTSVREGRESSCGGGYRSKVRLAQHLGKDVSLGSSRIGQAVPAMALIRCLPQAVPSLSGCAGDAILDGDSRTKKIPGAEKRIFPDHRCCLSNSFIAYTRSQRVLRSVVTSSIMPSNPADQ